MTVISTKGMVGSDYRQLDTAIAANTDILDDDFATVYRSSYIQLYIISDTECTVSIVRKIDGSTITGILNNGTVLNANCPHTFTIMAHEGELYNVQVSAGSTIKYIYLKEVL